MSDHYLFHFNFALKHDAPEALTRSLGLLAEGKMPSDGDVTGLPRIVGSYLQSGGVPGDGVYHFQRRDPLRPGPGGTWVSDETKAPLRTFDLRMAQTFHDDEYYNGGIYWPFWLMQFAAYDGPIATKQQTNGGGIPGVISKFGDRIIETELQYAPDWLCQEPPDPDTPVVVSRTADLPLAEMLNQLSDFADGYAWE